MAKLTKAMQKKVGDAPSGDFEALDDGIYPATLMAVNTDKTGKAGPYWQWEFRIDGPDEVKGRKAWVNTSLSEAALWKMKEIYDALEFELDSDTDEMCGTACKLVLTQRVIESGSRKGQMGNNVDRVMAAGESADSEEDADDVF